MATKNSDPIQKNVVFTHPNKLLNLDMATLSLPLIWAYAALVKRGAPSKALVAVFPSVAPPLARNWSSALFVSSSSRLELRVAIVILKMITRLILEQTGRMREGVLKTVGIRSKRATFQEVL